MNTNPKPYCGADVRECMSFHTPENCQVQAARAEEVKPPIGGKTHQERARAWLAQFQPYPPMQAWVDSLAALLEESSKPAEGAILIEPEEVPGAFAALCSMVIDVHAPEDQLTEVEFKGAETAFKKVEAEMNRRLKESKAARRKNGGK